VKLEICLENLNFFTRGSTTTQILNQIDAAGHTDICKALLEAGYSGDMSATGQ